MSYGTVQAEKVTTESGYSLGAGNASSFKNRFINGSMQVYQRNTGTPPTITTGGQFALDRWKLWANGGGGSGASFTVQQSSTAPAGFSTSMLITQTAAAPAPTGGVYNCFAQYIEGYNAADLNWGSANAKSVTISFWVRSSVTGTYGGAVTNADQSRSYAFNYSISAANTWEQKTVTIPGDTSGTWTTDNTLGIAVFWGLGVGSTYLGVAGSWASATYLSATGSTNIVTTNGATFYVTGVQLEVGTVATSFDFRDYGRELILCQRYYQIYATPSHRFFGSSTYTAGVTVSYEQLGVEMRATPTLAQSGGGTTGVLVNASTGATSTVTVYLYQPASSVRAFQFYPDGATNGQVYFVAGLPNILCSAEL